MSGSETGAGNTPVQKNLSSSYIIDWLGYSGPHDSQMHELWEGSGPLPWVQDSGPGRYGYEQKWLLGTAEFWRAGPGDTDHVDLSGRACRDLEIMAAQLGEIGYDWAGHIAWLLASGRAISRLDFSIDVRGSGASVEPYAQAVRAGKVVSRWKPRTHRELRGIAPGEEGGHTLYLGSPKSAARLLIYDKRAESKLGSAAEAWIRIELRARAEAAKALGRAIADGGMEGGLAALRSYARFLGDDGQELPDWVGATTDVAPTPLHVLKRGGSIASKRSWIESQVKSSLAMLMAIDGGDTDWILNLIRQGVDDLTDRQRSTIMAERARLDAQRDEQTKGDR